MKRKNVFLLVTLVLTLALVFIGCGGNERETFTIYRMALTEANYKANFNGFLDYDALNDDEYTLLSGEGLLTATENAYSAADNRKARFPGLVLSDIEFDLNMAIYDLSNAEIGAFRTDLADNGIAVHVFKFTSVSASAFNSDIPDENKVSAGEVLVYTAVKE